MTNLPFDFDVPLVDPQVHSFTAPVQGKTALSRHAGWTGARAQVKTFGPKTSALLQVLANGGPMSRNELWAVLRWNSLSSVCSILGGCLKRGIVESSGEFESITWPDGQVTRRERFQIRRSR